jgi:hypothetical protein
VINFSWGAAQQSRGRKSLKKSPDPRSPIRWHNSFLWLSVGGARSAVLKSPPTCFDPCFACVSQSQDVIRFENLNQLLKTTKPYNNKRTSTMVLQRAGRAGQSSATALARALAPQHGPMVCRRHKSGPYGYTQAKALVYSKYGEPSDVLS